MQHPSEADPFDSGRVGRRLRVLAEGRLERDEQPICWTRAWVSIDGRWSWLLGARTRDFAVLTDRRILLWSTGFFTRRPRRRVLADRLDELTVTRGQALSGCRLLVTSRGHRRLRFDLARGAASERFVDELLERVRSPEHGNARTVAT